MATALFLLSLLAFPTSILAESNPKVVAFDFEKREVFAEQNLQRRGSDNTEIYNAQGSLLYLVNVTVGTPGQKLQLQLDTGSSDIWIPSASSSQCTSRAQRCVNGGQYDSTTSSSYKLLQQGSFLISYVDGTRIRGDYIGDTFTIGSASVDQMTMGLATTATEQSSSGDFQGIIGVGFEVGEAVYAQTGRTYKNIISRLKESNVINTRAYSLWLNDKNNGKGTILFGGVDTEKYHGDLVSLPIQPDARTGTVMSFTVALDNFNVVGADGKTQYSRTNMSLPVILDSGTTLTYLPDQIAQDLYTGVGAVVSNTYGVVVPCDLASSPAIFNFGFGNPNGPVIAANIGQFVLPFPEGFPIPKFKSTGKEACRWGIQAANGKPFLFGDTFLRAAYVVYNIDNNEIGLANANFNTTKTNIKEITQPSQIPGVTSTAAGVVAKATNSGVFGPPQQSFGAGGTGAVTAAGGSATFNLGGATGSSGSKNAASGPSSPSMAVIGFIAGFVTLLMAAGGVMVIGV